MVKIELSDSEARRLRDEWEARASDFAEQAASLREAITAIDAQLAGKLPERPTETQATSAPSRLPPPRRKKRRKGQNLRTVKGFLVGLEGKGATVAEITKGTGIATSSAVAVLKNNAKVFHKGDDGLWKLL